MAVMHKVAGLKGFLIWLGLLGVLCEFGCSRQVGVPTGESAEQTTQTPFHDDSVASTSLADSSATASFTESRSSLPFHDAQSLPAGTLLMVRLKESVSTAKPDSKDSFEATLDSPVVVEGNVLFARGCDVTGRIESFRTSQMKPGRGYIQLALQSIQVGGVDVPVQTASLFVRQTSVRQASMPQPSMRQSSGHQASKDSSSSAIRLEKGHRLTFRLLQPVYAANQGQQISR